MHCTRQIKQLEMTDPYEQQLLAVFESCDVRGTGKLDCEGLTKLCDQLHLEDGRLQLMDCLLPAFTFDQFRDALLALLGASRKHSSDIKREPSPEREVSPKFVFGQKKYGRRSRPESTDQEGDEDENYDDPEDYDAFLPLGQDVSIDLKKPSDLLINDCHSDRETVITPTSVEAVVQEEIESLGGQGEAELRAAWHRLGVGTEGYLDPTELAAVCRAIGMEKMADEVVKQVFAKLDVDAEGKISFEEFVQLFQGTHTVNTSPAHPHLNCFQQQPLISLDITSSGYVSSDSLVDLLEAGGVVNAAGFLLDLGVSNTSEISINLLTAILDEEIRSMASKSVSISPQVNSLTAALILAQAQLKWTRSCLEQMTGERDKLHNDLADANQRANLLAHEIDDRHARMERASQIQIKLLEQRHAEQVKQLSIQLTMDRDQLTATTLRLEKKLAAQQDEEARLRTDLQSLKQECEVMEKENQNLTEQLSACEGVKIKAERDCLQMQQLQQRVQELESSSEQVQSLVEQLARLQTENTSLRDRNDELTIQVENLSSRPLCKRQNSSSSVDGIAGGGTKRRGNSPLAPVPDHSWDEDSPRLGKVRRYCTDNDLSLDSVPLEGLAIGKTLSHSESGLEADPDTLDNSLTLSSVDKVTFNIGGNEEAYLTEIEHLRSSVADLQKANEDYKKRLAAASCSTDNMKAANFHIQVGNRGCIVNKAPAGDIEHSDIEKIWNSFAVTSTTESTEVQTSLENQTDVDLLEKHCHELRHTLDNVQEEILKILSEKKACNEENCALKQRIEELSKRLPKSFADDAQSLENPSGPLTYTVSDACNSTLQINSSPFQITNLQPFSSENVNNSPDNIALRCFPFMNHKQSNSDSPYCLFPVKDIKDNGCFKFENLSQFAFELSQSLSDSNFTNNLFSDLGIKPLSPCFSEKECKSEISVNRKLNMAQLKRDDPIIVIDQNSENTKLHLNSTLLTENMKELMKKCSDLETALELMREEYEKCEDYWQSKLNEERAIFDQEQRLSDEKFAELESKIQEYAELFAVDDKKGNGHLLPTIDERDSLEKQVTDLEEEFEEFRKAAQKESQGKTEKIDMLLVELEELQKKLKDKEKDTIEIGVQVSDQSREFRLQDPHPSPQSKVCVPVIEVTGPDSIECCCPCHVLSRKNLSRLRDCRARLQSDCEMLHRRREVMLHQLTQLHQRTNLLYTPMPDRRLASDVEMFHNLSSRLRHQELRCRHLQSALKHHQRQTEKLLQSAWEQYRADLSAVQKTLFNTQEKLLHQTKLCKQQMERLAQSDVLVKDLYKENAHLAAKVQKLEEQNLFVDPSIIASTV